MAKFNALILADVHYGDLAQHILFGQSGPASDEDLTNVATAVVDAVKEQFTHIDMMFFLGDLTSRGTPGEFKEVQRFIQKLEHLLDLPPHKTFITYGNHDIDWRICNLETGIPERHIAYCEAAALLGSIFAPTSEFTHSGPVVGSGIYNFDGIDLICLNSGIECYEDQQVKHGKLAPAQYGWLRSEVPKHLRDGSTKIVMLHHHLLNLPYKTPVHDLSPLEEGPNVLNFWLCLR